MVLVKPDEARFLKDGYSLYDPQTFIRFDETFSKVTRENIIDIASLVNSSREPTVVKRLSLNLLKKYVLASKKKGRVMIKDSNVFFRTVIYYARIINGLPAVKPKKIHKGFKDFMLEYFNSNPELKKKFYKNKFEPQNIIYSTLSKTVVDKYPELEFHVFRVSKILGKLIRHHGYFTTKPQLSIAVLVHYIAKKNGYPSSPKKLSKAFMTSDAYILVLAKKHRDRLENMVSSLSQDEYKLLSESLKELLEKIMK